MGSGADYPSEVVGRARQVEPRQESGGEGLFTRKSELGGS